MIDCCATIQNPQELASLTTHVERERQIEKMIKGKLRHFTIRVLHYRGPKRLGSYHEVNESCAVAQKQREKLTSRRAPSPPPLCKNLNTTYANSSSQGERPEGVSNTRTSSPRVHGSRKLTIRPTINKRTHRNYIRRSGNEIELLRSSINLTATNWRLALLDGQR
jgi:hypothetical protein